MLTKDDIAQAIKISQTLQAYFEQHKNIILLRSTDAYEVLDRRGVVEKDRHQGIHFRRFLHHLKENNGLQYLPQCYTEKGPGNSTNWFFRPAADKTIRRKLIPIDRAQQSAQINLDDVKAVIASFPKREEDSLSYVEKTIRHDYPRAYDKWTEAEEKLLMEMNQKVKDQSELSRIFLRQPSTIASRLKKLLKE